MLFAIRNDVNPLVYLVRSHDGFRSTSGPAAARKFSTMGDLVIYAEACKLANFEAVELDPETFEFKRVVEVTGCA